jgi:hypothetical protein
MVTLKINGESHTVALYQSTSTTVISGKHSPRLASGTIQMLGAFIGTASSTISQMEKDAESFFATL